MADGDGCVIARDCPDQKDLMTKTVLALVLAFATLIPATAVQAETATQGRGLFAFLSPHNDRPARAARGSAAQEAARAALKEAVQAAIENRPRGRIWCVPFARTVSGIEIKGNAKTWWHQAEGRYDRGDEPKVGAVMAFSASRSMPKGHVAVVSKVISDRRVLVDQANWVRNKITTDTLVVDVSAEGDWSQVRVANANGTLGRANPVYGFIYN